MAGHMALNGGPAHKPGALGTGSPVGYLMTPVSNCADAEPVVITAISRESSKAFIMILFHM